VLLGSAARLSSLTCDDSSRGRVGYEGRTRISIRDPGPLRGKAEAADHEDPEKGDDADRQDDELIVISPAVLVLALKSLVSSPTSERAQSRTRPLPR